MSVLIAGALAPAACGQSGDGASRSSAETGPSTGESPSTPSGKPGSTAVASSASSKASEESKPLSAEEYERLISALASCAAKEDERSYYGYLDADCPPHKALQEATHRKDAWKELRDKDTNPIIKKMLAHGSPAVRVYAAGMMESLFGVTGENQNAVVEAAKKEKDPAVIKAMLHAIWNQGGRNPAVADLLLTFAAHENPRVRATAAVGISSSWNREMKGAAPKLIELMEKDPDTEVRKAACSYAGELGLDDFIPTYRKLTGRAVDPELAAECMEGLVKMWASYPFYKNRSEKAYRLTLERLQQQPRSEDFPPWTMLGEFEYLGTSKGGSIDEWKKASTWFDAAALRAALGEVMMDHDANWMGRSAALKSVLALQATRAELEKWRKAYPDKPVFKDESFVKDLDKAIAGAK